MQNIDEEDEEQEDVENIEDQYEEEVVEDHDAMTSPTPLVQDQPLLVEYDKAMEHQYQQYNVTSKFIMWIELQGRESDLDSGGNCLKQQKIIGCYLNVITEDEASKC